MRFDQVDFEDETVHLPNPKGGPGAAFTIVSRFGPGAYRVTASALEPTRLRWEYIVVAMGK